MKVSVLCAPKLATFFFFLKLTELPSIYSYPLHFTDRLEKANFVGRDA